jgi:uncharacterized protein YkwD
MLKRPPSDTSNTINSFRKKRQQQGQFLMYGAIALVVLGLILLIYWLTRPEQPLGRFFATDTPTVTVTSTATTTSTPTLTPTITETPTITVTATPSEPFPYTIQEGDALETISQRFNLGPDGPLLIYYENQELLEPSGGVIFPGQTILIPLPGTVLPTTTPIPPNLRSGTLIAYTILPGDTLAGIAFKFNSIADNIIAENEDLITDPNALRAGEVLQIPVNLVTPTATLPSTSTPVTPTVAGGTATSASTAATSAPGGTASEATCSFDENPDFVTQLQTLINDERTSAGLPALTVNAQLATAAKDHAVDMLCNDYLSHISPDGSTPEDRAQDAGFTASLVLENLYALHPAYGGNPQSAFDWWMNDADSKADLLNANTTVVGIAYVTSDESLLGGYFVVLSARP